METNEKEADRLTGVAMEVHPTSLGIGRYDREDGAREMFLIPTSSLGLTLPAWERREDMVAMWSVMYPDRDSRRLAFVMVENPDAFLSFSRTNNLTIIINPRYLDNGHLLYGRLVWN